MKAGARSMQPAAGGHTGDLLVVTDLDGSLLDHHDYSYSAAEPALELLEALGIPLVFASSKTREEILRLRRQMSNAHPFIVENGAAVFIPRDYFAEQPRGTEIRGDFWVREMAPPRSHWIALLERLERRFPGEYEYFFRAGVDGIAAMTGLDPARAALANAREYTEPVQWRGEQASLANFLDACREAGAQVARGGRFYSVGGDADKGRALRWLREAFALAHGIPHIEVLAAGDSDNDASMLDAADTALLIRAEGRPLPRVMREQGVLVSEAVGPAGWAEGVTQWLCRQGRVS